MLASLPWDEVICYISVFSGEITASVMPLQGQRLWGGWGEPFPGSGPRSVQFWGRISVTDLSHQHTATQVCDNHSWKMKSAVRQTNCINTYSCVAPCVDTDVTQHWSGGQVIYFLLFIFNSRVEEGRVKGLPRAKWNNDFLLMAQSVTSVIKKGHFWRCKWATCTNMCN